MAKSPRELKLDKITLRLYFTGQSPKSVSAIANLKIICNDYLFNHNVVEFVDVLEQPLRLIRDNIPTTPLLIRVKPLPERRILGDLSNWKQVLGALEISAPA